MGGVANFVGQRLGFLEAFNQAFRADRITETATRLGPQARAMDALEISHRLGFLDWVPIDRFFKYRDKVGIPALHLRIVTEAIQAALQSPQRVGVTMNIVEGPAEGVTVSEGPGVIAITLIRTGFDPVEATS